MLKKICRLFLGLVVFMGSACVTPTHASSALASVLLVHIQAASPTSAKDEMVSIYNNSPNDIDITNWCVKNKSNVSFACFTPNDVQHAYYLPAYSFATVASESFITTNTLTAEMVSKVFTVTNQSSGSIVNSGDTISLADARGQQVDSVSWTSAIPSGKLMIRTKTGADPRVYDVLDSGLAWAAGTLSQLPSNQLEVREVPVPDTPEEPTDPPVDTPDTPEVTVPIHLEITEVFPDAVGSDAGNEFIEVYNPDTSAVSLSDYKLRVGPNLEKTYSFPVGSTVLPLGYSAFTNGQIAFTLVNTSSKVQLEYKGSLVGQPVMYTTPPEGESWALLNGIWGYTSLVTPGAVNQASPFTDETDIPAEVAVTPKPCAANQYRSPETNRCRLLVTASTSSVQPCKEGQVRNPDTNRCRAIASTSSTQTACKAGQERNPETNRCRNIVKMTSTNYGVKGVSTEHTSTTWYMWLGIGGVVALIVGYAVWEWRDELRQLGKVLQQKVARIKR